MARRWAQLLVDAIDPLLAGGPFQAGQTEDLSPDRPHGDEQPGASVIWCGPYAKVAAAYPHLPRDAGEIEPGWCYDITVSIDADGRLARVELETGDLDTASGLIGRPAEVAVPALAELLRGLLVTDEDMTTRLRDDLTAALRARDRDTARVLRTLLAAIANAEAQPVDDPTPTTLRSEGAIAGAAEGLGAAEVARRDLGPDDLRAVLLAERDERSSTAADLEARGAADAAAALRAEATVVERYL